MCCSQLSFALWPSLPRPIAGHCWRSGPCGDAGLWIEYEEQFSSERFWALTPVEQQVGDVLDYLASTSPAFNDYLARHPRTG